MTNEASIARYRAARAANSGTEPSDPRRTMRWSDAPSIGSRSEEELHSVVEFASEFHYALLN